ncbi:hypothetical protein OUZ56_033064 [Daphnia magna]|uniref:Uncharacterized protein n=1 Tax=Daphnia magna TaxID=35525 RepID=A0ABQ9ZXM8_9CRUS|nr:hypothetical protein OUZ56_033064 [Daphnia magna]
MSSTVCKSFNNIHFSMETYGERADVSKLYTYDFGAKLLFTNISKIHGEILSSTEYKSKISWDNSVFTLNTKVKTHGLSETSFWTSVGHRSREPTTV